MSEKKTVQSFKNQYYKKIKKHIRKLKFHLWIEGAMGGIKWHVETYPDLTDVYMRTYIDRFWVDAELNYYDGMYHLEYEIRENDRKVKTFYYWFDVKDYIGEKIAIREYKEVMNQKR